jgi:hypothetical protein
VHVRIGVRIGMTLVSYGGLVADEKK